MRTITASISGVNNSIELGTVTQHVFTEWLLYSEDRARHCEYCENKTGTVSALIEITV